MPKPSTNVAMLLLTLTLAACGRPEVRAPDDGVVPMAEKTHAGSEEPRALVRLGASAKSAVASDADTTASRFRVEPRVDDVTFAIDNEHPPYSDLVATSGGKERWRAKGYMVAGGGFGVQVSQRGTLVMRVYSRGQSELFDARTGRRLGEVGRALELSPDETFAIDIPVPHPFTGAWARKDIAKLKIGDGALSSTSIATLTLSDGDSSDGRGAAMAFRPAASVAISPDSRLIAILHLATLTVYRASDVSRLATIDGIPNGVLHFTNSGQIITIRGDDATLLEAVRLSKDPAR
jgi:hypothetical protein